MGWTWCREGESNPHRAFAPADFKSAASANFAIPAIAAKLLYVRHIAVIRSVLREWRALRGLSLFGLGLAPVFLDVELEFPERGVAIGQQPGGRSG